MTMITYNNSHFIMLTQHLSLQKITLLLKSSSVIFCRDRCCRCCVNTAPEIYTVRPT